MVLGNCKNYLPPQAAKQGGPWAFQSHKVSLWWSREVRPMSLPFFFLNQRSLLVDCVLLGKPTSPSKPATSLEWQGTESTVTLKCPLWRHVLLRFSRCCMKSSCATWHLLSLPVRDNLSLIQGASLSRGTLILSAPSGPVKGPPGKLLPLSLKSDVPMSQGVRSLINSSCLEISNRLFQTLISCFNFLSLRIGSKSLSLVCSVLNLQLDKKIKIVLSEYLSISIIGNTRHRGFGWRSCIAGRFSALHLSLPKNRCHYTAHTDLRHSPFTSQTD